MLKYILTRIIIGIFVFAMVRAIVTVSGLDAMAARMLNAVAEESTIAWGIAGAVGLIAVILWQVFHVDQRLAIIFKPPVAPTKSVNAKPLQQFYVEAGPIIDRSLPKDISADALDAYVAGANAWVQKTATWIEKNMSLAARERFLDRTGMMGAFYSTAVNERHNQVILNMTRLRQNLLVLIESGAWD